MKPLHMLIAILFVFLSGCKNSVDITGIPYTPKIVVEGSIENGTFSSVLLSVSAPITGEQDTVNLLQHAIRNALVVVSDDENSDTLYLQTNRNRLPPYEYKGRKIKGETGKHYRLKVEYDGDTIRSTTYIPATVAIEDIWFRRKNPTDTTGYIGVSFRNEAPAPGFYQLATSPFAVRDVFTPCLYGNIESSRYPQNELISVELNKGPSLYPKNDFSTLYRISDTIRIKLSTQPREAYDFWNSFQNEVLNSQNTIYPAFSSLKSNISGGIGIWSGYGSVQRIVILSRIEQ